MDQTTAPSSRDAARLPLSHPDRAFAILEAHARPAPPVPVPSTIHHVALSCDEWGASRLYDAVFRATAADLPRHAVLTVDGMAVTWEMHTEFVSLTVVDGGWAEPFDALMARIARIRGDVGLVLALRITVSSEEAGEERHLPEGSIGGTLRGGVTIASTFKPCADGFVDIAVEAGKIGPAQLGRRVKRLIEAETYRVMAFLGLPLARREGQAVAELETRLGALVGRLTEGAAADEEMLDDLQAIAAEVEAVKTRTRFRFGASRAYAALVDERVRSLGETKIGERPTFSGFALARLRPSLRTIETLEERQADLAAAVGRTLEMLRARVDISMERANQAILASMNERHERQLRLAQAVEGLSVIAISYYLTGLIAYPAKALLGADGAAIALALLAPAIAIATWLALHRLKKRLLG